MIFPDQSHLNRVREGLWQKPNGCASLMVGAGFSRNARKPYPDTPDFPLWNSLVTVLCTRLYSTSDKHRLQKAITEASGTSGFLRLSQEYEAAFGRSALHSLIQELVPDEDYVPDDLHTRLLRLPWEDVFTTNWDTLLERTKQFVADRAYGVVRTPSEIPSVPRPRIVKLHGSLPAHIPFIFTEEDYRTYPERFSPFVNTVQQAMMETVFLLIGFSGDDPNFLHWSGWVRDNLGDSAPIIYIAGWLDLSSHRRRMLETRNVVPIDLAGHPQATCWPEHLRHRYATEWIIQSLELGRPYDVTQWPFVPNTRPSPRTEPLLQPVEEVTVDGPKDNPPRHASGTEATDLPQQVRDLTEVWKHNRRVYPGWLIIPRLKHRRIQIALSEGEQAIRGAARQLNSIERLSVIHELVWLQEHLLQPLSKQIEEFIQSILDDFDCSARTIQGREDRSLAWADIREAWRSLAMARLTAARRRVDRNTFDEQLVALLPFIDDHPDIRHRIDHEKCLWALSDLDYTGLEGLLNTWQPERCDPIWFARKAAILVEIDRADEARGLLFRSLSILREKPPADRTLAGPSREGWELWMALAFEFGHVSTPADVLEGPSAFDRWTQLAGVRCDAHAEKREYLEALRDDPEKKRGPLFDLGMRRGITRYFSNADHERWLAAQQAIRLCEVAGLPPAVNHVVVASDILTLAADHLIATDHTLAARLTLRLNQPRDDPTFDRIWSRCRIAAMPMNEVTQLVVIVTNSMGYVLQKAANANVGSTFWVARLSVMLEALSRLVLRLPPARAEDIFKRGLTWYRMQSLAKNPRLHSGIKHLLARSWEALPKHLRTMLALDVLSAPISGLQDISTTEPTYPDPGQLLGEDDELPLPARTVETESRWTEIVNLIARALATRGEARKRAAYRLTTLAIRDRFSDSENKRFAQALWSTAYTAPDTLPRETDLHDWVFLLLPEPEMGLAEKRLRRKWFRPQELKEEKEFNEFLFQVGLGLSALRKHQRPLILVSEERNILAAIIEEWCKIPAPLNDDLLGSVGTLNGISGLQAILSDVELLPRIADDLYGRATDLNQTGTPSFRLAGALAKCLPDHIDDIAMSIRVGLASDKRTVAEEAVVGLHTWLRDASREVSSIPSPPADLFREIGVIIANRRKGVLVSALHVAYWIFSEGRTEQRGSIAQLTLDGLRYLIDELSYDREHSADDEADIPLLRSRCAHLALAMAAAGHDTDQTVIRWAQVVRDDPLPEVRYIETAPFARLQW